MISLLQNGLQRRFSHTEFARGASHETRHSEVLLALLEELNKCRLVFLFCFVFKCMFINVQILQAASREGGPACKEQARAPRLQPPPSQAGRPSRPPAPPPPAPSETNAAHGGLYGARRQRVARLTLRGKFGGGRQGALMRGPPAAAAARGGGGCGAGRKREPGSRAATPAHSPTPPPPATDRLAGGGSRKHRAAQPGSLLPLVTPFQAPCFSVPPLPPL